MGCHAFLQGQGREVLPDSGIKPMSPVSPALARRFFTISAIWKAHSRAVGKFSGPQIQRVV